MRNSSIRTERGYSVSITSAVHACSPVAWESSVRSAMIIADAPPTTRQAPAGAAGFGLAARPQRGLQRRPPCRSGWSLFQARAVSAIDMALLTELSPQPQALTPENPSPLRAATPALQARCWRGTGAMLARCWRDAFIFASCSPRIPFVFSSYSYGFSAPAQLSRGPPAPFHRIGTRALVNCISARFSQPSTCCQVRMNTRELGGGTPYLLKV